MPATTTMAPSEAPASDTAGPSLTKLSISMTPPRHVRMLDAAASFGMSAKLIPTTAMPASKALMSILSSVLAVWQCMMEDQTEACSGHQAADDSNDGYHK